MHSRLLTAALLLLLSFGCAPAPAAPAALPITAPSATAAETERPAPPTPPASPLLEPTPLPRPQAATAWAPAPTPTPSPETIIVAVPAWLPQFAAQPPATDARYVWEVVPLGDPAAALANGVAQVALLPGDGAAPDGLAAAAVGDRPVALVVPFTTPWEATSFDYAQDWIGKPDAPFTLRDFASLTPQDKALAVASRYPNETGYPFQQPWQIAGAPAVVAALQPWAAALLNDEPLLTLAAVGDLMLDRGLGYAIAAQNQIDYPFALVADSLRAADLTVGNFEAALGSGGTPAPKSYTFLAPPAAAASIAHAGFDVVSLANNHALDFGAETLLEGIGLLGDQGVAAIGAGPNAAVAHAPWITQVNGLTLAFLAYVHVPVEVSGFDTATWTATDTAAGLAWAEPARVAADVAAVAPQVDHVIVVLHSGYEYVAAPSPPQQAAARAAVDAGAALVIGHHAHILQGVAFYGSGVIVYGLGNFAFEIDGDPRTAILNVWLDARGVRQISFTPALIQFGGQPRPATLDEAADIRALIYRQTAALNDD